MTRLKLILQYKGTAYSGWQSQPNGNTIQQHLEKALSVILRQKIRVHGASRTDAGVHALGQVCHCDVEGELSNPPASPLKLRGDTRLPPLKVRGGGGELCQFFKKIRYSLNSILSDDISVVAVEPVKKTFNAQNSAKRKTYVYQILNSPVPSPFLGDYVWRVPHHLNVTAMRRAAKHLVGRHDFKAFCAADSSVKTTERAIFSLIIKKNPTDPSDPTDRSDLIVFKIEGNGFLKQMVRNIVGTLVGVGRGKMTPLEVKKILSTRDRKKAGMAAPAKGLFLVKVGY